MLIVKRPIVFLFIVVTGLANWYTRNNTKVLCAGLDYYCYQTVRQLPPFFL